MKRLLSVLLVICLLSAFFVPAASAVTVTGNCGVNLTWAFDEETGVLTIEGYGDMQEIKTSTTTPWADYKAKIKRVELPDGLTSISAYAFYDCVKLTNIVIPESVVTVGSKAFSGCESLVTAVIGSGVEELGTKVFSYCPNLIALTFGGNSNLDVIPKATFEHSTNLEVVYFNGTSKQWKNDVDVEGSNHIDNDIVDCREAADNGTSGSTDWVFDHMSFTLTISGSGAMRDYSSMGDRPWDEYESYIHTVIVESGVTEIGDRAFASFTNLDRVFIGEDVTSIGNQAFSSCNALREVYYGGSRDTWSTMTIGSSNSDLTTASIYCADDCRHTTVEDRYTPNGDETHTGVRICSTCGIELSNPVVADCGDEDLDGKCEICGGDVAIPETPADPEEPECTHANAAYDYVQNKDGVNHSVWMGCNECGAYLDMGVESCADENTDGVCDKCGETIDNVGGEGGGENTCTHETTEVTYEVVDGKTHLVRTICQTCFETVSSVSANCADTDVNYVCDVCESDMEYVKYKYDAKTGTLTFYGNTAMEDYAGVNDMPWAALRSNINKVVIGDGITHIGRRTFYNCASLTEVTIPLSVKSIDNYAFYRCNGLKTVNYGGTQNTWNAIEIGVYNEPLLNAALVETCLHENKTETIVQNKDGTHTVTTDCLDCGLNVGEVSGECVGVDTIVCNNDGTHTAANKCEVCGREYSSETVACTAGETSVKSNGNYTHTVTVACSVCDGAASVQTVKCADGADEDENCDECGFNVQCAHGTYVLAYNSNGDHKTHTYAYNCNVCGAECNAIRDEDCSGVNGETCDKCHQDYSCQHNEEDLRTETEYHNTTKTDVYTHNKMTVVYCDGEDCDLPERIFSSEIVEEQNCADTDDDKCDLCGRDMVCGHENTTTTNTNNGHNTHQLVVTCNICGDKVQDVEVNCVYRELGGTCMICKTACTHEFTYTYTKKADAEQHYTAAECDYCGYKPTDVLENCIDTQPHDGSCDTCGGAVACKHQQKVAYKADGTGWHEIFYTCDTCAEEEASASCSVCKAFWGYDEDSCEDTDDEGYACDICGDEFVVAAVNNVAFADVYDAFYYAQDGDTVYLMKDVDFYKQLIIDKDITLDFGGSTLTTYAVNNDYSVKIKGNVTIEDGIFDVAGVYGIQVYPDVEFVINGGEFNAAEDNDYLIGNWGKLTINDGQFNGVYCAVNNFAGTTDIYGGTFSTEDLHYEEWDDATDLMADAGMTVYGGTYSKPVAEELIAEGYVCNADGVTYVVEKKSEIVKFDLAGSNMTLGNELEVNFLFLKKNLTETDCTAIVTHYMADGTTKVTEIPQADWGAMGSTYHKVSTRIAAKEMADKLTIEIVNADGYVLNNEYSDSARGYAGRALAASSTTEFVRIMMIDMLNYGAAAQNHFKYNASDLANNALTEEQQALATAKVTCTDNQVKDSTVHGANLSLEDSILLNSFFKGLKGKDIASMYAMVTFTDFQGIAKEVRVDGTEFEKYGSSGDIYKIVVDDVVLADAKQMVTVTLYNADGTVFGVNTDSVESYVARAEANNADTYGLYANIMKFATSAYNYIINK